MMSQQDLIRELKQIGFTAKQEPTKEQAKQLLSIAVRWSRESNLPIESMFNIWNLTMVETLGLAIEGRGIQHDR